MNFPDRFKVILARTAEMSGRSMWTRSITFSLVVLLACTAYIFIQAGWGGITTLNRAVASAAMILIGMSFIASGVCYFWDFADKHIIYRKYWGLMGFWFVCVHGLISLAQRSFDFGYFLLPQNIVAFMSALIAFAILVMMALISNMFAVRELGGKRWRALLRLGYIAYVFSIIHMTMKAYPQWVAMDISGNPIPPISIPIAVFGIIVILMRLALAIALYRKATHK